MNKKILGAIAVLLIMMSFSAFAQTDTLKTYFDRSSGFQVYTYSNGAYPLTGSNNMYSMLGSKFLFSGEAMLKGVLVAFAEKKIAVNNKRQIIVYHLDEQGQMPTGTAIGVGEFSLNQIIADKDKPIFTWLPLNVKPAAITKSFGVMIHTRTALQNDDFISIFSNKQGDGQGMRTAFDVWAGQDGSPQYEDLYDFPEATDIGDKPNVDVMIIPVLDYSQSVVERINFNGLKIISAGPNPSANYFSLKVSSVNSSPLKVSLIDINGKEIYFIERDIAPSGEEVFEFDMSKCSSGTYFYIIQSSKAKFSGIITKVD